MIALIMKVPFFKPHGGSAIPFRLFFGIWGFFGNHSHSLTMISITQASTKKPFRRHHDDAID
jgi:hypothetical protein